MASPTHPSSLRFGTELEGQDAALHRVAAGVKRSFDLDLNAFFPAPGHLILVPCDVPFDFVPCDVPLPEMMNENG